MESLQQPINIQHNKRMACQYDLGEQLIMRKKKQIVSLQIELMEDEKRARFFENQTLTASQIVSAFKDRRVLNVMVVSKTQSGKTGTMCATIKNYIQDPDNLIPIENIYIITGLSSCEWKEQTKERMPEAIQQRVFHRTELPTTFADEIDQKKNILIIMDEIQVAAKKDQTIFKTFQKANMLDKNNLYAKDIKIVEFSATPDGTIYDLMRWKEASQKILAQPGENYISSYQLLQQGRVKQYKDLCGFKQETQLVDQSVFQNIQELRIDVDAYEKPLYHIIRTKNGKHQEVTIQNFQEVFGTEHYNYSTYDVASEENNINQILSVEPLKHTFIFIKEMLRCAKTIDKRFKGISYERFTLNPDDTAIVQGLVGRDTGYDNNPTSICYTNIESIEKYELLWNSNFSDMGIKWHSKTTKQSQGQTQGHKTFNDIKNYCGFGAQDEACCIAEKEPEIKKFSTQEEAKRFYNQFLKGKFGGRGPNQKHPDAEGFYLSTIGKEKVRTKVRSTKEIWQYRRWNLNETHHYTFHPCYEDVTDKQTLQWWLIFYP